jgi:hypothetical protein
VLEHACTPEAGLLVQARFKLADERSARELAAKLIDRAHELANTPECECDLDVSVEWNPPGAGESSRDPLAQVDGPPVRDPAPDR